MLKTIRENKGLSQTKLAKYSGVKLHQIQFYEQCYRDIDGAHLSTLVKLATTLECSISDLLNSKELIEECKKVRL